MSTDMNGGGFGRREDGSYICPRCGQGRNLHFIGSECMGCEHCMAPPGASAANVLREAMKKRDAWQQTAVQQGKNADHYCDLLDQIAESLGRKAYVNEGGREQDDPVYANLPALVAERLADYEKLDLLFVQQGRAVHEVLKVFEAVRNNGITNALPKELHQRYREASEALDIARDAIRDEALKRWREP